MADWRPPGLATNSSKTPHIIPVAACLRRAAVTAFLQPGHLVVAGTAVSGSQSGLWMTHDAGLFQEQALDVELINIASTSRVIQAMMAGEVQMGSLDPAATVEASLNGAE